MNIETDQWPKRHAFTVDEYYRMAEVGLLRTDARVELIQGEIVDMAPIGSWHAAVVDELTRMMIVALRGRAMVGIQRPVRLDARTEPQPDLVVLRPRADAYRSSHPGPSDVYLIIEVSDSTVRFDREVKLPLYARRGIPELWIFDLPAKQVHCMRRPVGAWYESSVSVGSTGTVQIESFPDVSIGLASLLT